MPQEEGFGHFFALFILKSFDANSQWLTIMLLALHCRARLGFGFHESCPHNWVCSDLLAIVASLCLFIAAQLAYPIHGWWVVNLCALPLFHLSCLVCSFAEIRCGITSRPQQQASIPAVHLNSSLRLCNGAIVQVMPQNALNVHGHYLLSDAAHTPLNHRDVLHQ